MPSFTALPRRGGRVSAARCHRMRHPCGALRPGRDVIDGPDPAHVQPRDWRGEIVPADQHLPGRPRHLPGLAPHRCQRGRRPRLAARSPAGRPAAGAPTRAQRSRCSTRRVPDTGCTGGRPAVPPPARPAGRDQP